MTTTPQERRPGRSPVVVFDVNETLSDMTPMRRRFADVGAPEHAAPLWFATVLRDGFALTAAGAPRGFTVLADGILRGILSGTTPDRDMDAAVEHVLAGFMELDVHPDVAEGVRALAAAGVRLVTLSNGAAEVAERLLATAGIRGHFERCLSVDDAGAWKPARRAYAYAGEVCGVAPADMLMVAVHAWDLDGARRAGLSTAWVNRAGGRYPGHFAAPDHVVTTMSELAGLLR